MNRHFLAGALLVCGVTIATGPAAAADTNSFDLYSWAQKGTSNYCYAILPSIKEARSAADVKASKDQVCGGRDDLKRILGQVAPPESTIVWKVNAKEGLVLPTRDIENELKRFSETIPYTLMVPERK